jgi:hypothetical protein
MFCQLRQKHRKSWTVPACLSTQPNTMFVSFRAWGHIGRIVSEDSNKKVDMQRSDGNPGANPTKRDIPNFTRTCELLSQICVKFFTNF